MVNNIIFEYLKENSEKYKLDELKQEIVSKGYTEDEYYEALKVLNSKKFKSGDVSRLPNSHVVREKKKGSLGRIFLIFVLLILLGFGVVVLLNYFDFSVFGFNVFNYF